jgi:hypothetical protein
LPLPADYTPNASYHPDPDAAKTPYAGRSVRAGGRRSHKGRNGRQTPCPTPLTGEAGTLWHAEPTAAASEPSPTPDRLSERSERDAVAGEAGAVAGAVAVLDTTAQLLQPGEACAHQRDAGDPESPDPAVTLSRRARAKVLTGAIVRGLFALGEETPLRYGYARTLACAGELHQAGEEIRGKYCGNRWCGVCNRVRTAKLRNAYTPELSQWRDAWFVTLTVPNVKGRHLADTIRTLTRAVREIANDVRRTDRLTWRAVRKVEVTYNTRRRDFHPHLHLIVAGEAAARMMLKRWLARFPTANRKAQDVRKSNGDKAMQELFKYLTKQTVLVDGKVTAPPARALDTIYRAVRRLRTIQPMGFKVQGEPDEVTEEDTALVLDAATVAKKRYATWEWDDLAHDWIDRRTGELLTGYEPDAATVETLQRIARDAFPQWKPPPERYPVYIRHVARGRVAGR